MYLQADMQLKEQALAKTTAAQARVSRYRPPDRVLAFLNTLQLFRQLRTHQRAILQKIEPLRSHCRNNPLAGIMANVMYARQATFAVPHVGSDEQTIDGLSQSGPGVA